jgi:hypothetical protein
MLHLRSRGLNAAIVDRFADGNWHSVWEVVAACGHLIPPEIAVRVARGARMIRGDLHETVDKGRRRRIAGSLKMLGAEQGGVGKGGWDSFRLTPGLYGYVRGSSSPAAKLSEADVSQIRLRHAEGGVTLQQLADEYGVSQSSIGKAVSRKTWRHV